MLGRTGVWGDSGWSCLTVLSRKIADTTKLSVLTAKFWFVIQKSPCVAFLGILSPAVFNRSKRQEHYETILIFGYGLHIFNNRYDEGVINLPSWDNGVIDGIRN